MPEPNPLFIPSLITVHMGEPQSAGADIPVFFPDYIRQAAACSICPTWEPAAIRACLLVITSLALHRVHTGYYRSQGYPFDITASAAWDQAFLPDGFRFENISLAADEMLGFHLRRPGCTEPLAARFCDGDGDGLSRWGCQQLAQQGYDCRALLRTYFGDDIELVEAPPLILRTEAPPPPPPPEGAGRTPPQVRSENPVLSLQIMLGELSLRDSLLPHLIPSGVFDEATLEAVMLFQREVSLPITGRVDEALWAAIAATYRQAVRLSPSFGMSSERGGDPPYLAPAMEKGLSQVLEGLEDLELTGQTDGEARTSLTRLYALFVACLQTPWDTP